MKLETRNWLYYWLPAMLWAALVLFASGNLLSGAQTGSVLAAIVTALFGEARRDWLPVAHFVLRKLAHVSEYGVLAWLLYRARRQTQSFWNVNWATFALAGVLLIATVDEVHQHFVPSRTGSPVDVAIDLTGAILVLAIVRKRSRTFSGSPRLESEESRL